MFNIKRRQLFNIKKNPLKYSLHENEIRQLPNGEILRFGHGSYYKINKWVYDQVCGCIDEGPNRIPLECSDIM